MTILHADLLLHPNLAGKQSLTCTPRNADSLLLGEGDPFVAVSEPVGALGATARPAKPGGASWLGTRIPLACSICQLVC